MVLHKKYLWLQWLLCVEVLNWDNIILLIDLAAIGRTNLRSGALMKHPFGSALNMASGLFGLDFFATASALGKVVSFKVMDIYVSKKKQ